MTKNNILKNEIKISDCAAANGNNAHIVLISPANIGTPTELSANKHLSCL